MTFQEYLQTIPSENFTEKCFDIAQRHSNWARVESRCGAELVEEFNNDAIEEYESEWKGEDQDDEEDD